MPDPKSAEKKVLLPLLHYLVDLQCKNQPSNYHWTGVRVRNSRWDATFPPCTSLAIYPTQLAWRPDQTRPVSLARESAYAVERELRPATCETCAVCFLNTK
jgi:hypothetical protein